MSRVSSSTRRDWKFRRPLRFESLEPRRMLANYYVDPAGLGGKPNDNNVGSISQPLATILEAVDRAGPGDTIYLRGGTYSETNGNGPVGFNLSGLPGRPVTIRNYPSEQPIIDLGEYVHWQTNANGWYYADVSQETAAMIYTAQVEVQIVGGWTASPIRAASYQGGPAKDFQQPPAVFMQNGQLAYDLTWYDPAAQRLWFRSNTIQPVTNPDVQCAIVSPYSQFHLNSGSYVTIEGLQIQDGYTALHVESTAGAVVEDCRILHCAGQGILGGGSYSEIADNYIDYIGGDIIYRNGGYTFDQLIHCLYFGGYGASIHDNFFGETYSGYSAQIIAEAGAPTVIANNVFYGSYQCGMLLYSSSDAVVTGNVALSHPQIWRGTVLSSSGDGLSSYFSDPNITISGNYMEGAVRGFVLYSAFGHQPIQQMAIVGNTAVGGQYAGEIDGIPGIMNDNNWGGSANMVEFNTAVSYGAFLTWAQSLGFQSQSVNSNATTLNASSYDGQIGDNTTLSSALSLLRQYASAQIDAIAGLPSGTPTTIGGTSTPNAEGVTPVMQNVSYSLNDGTTLTVSSANSVLASDSDSDQAVTSLTANIYSFPLHGSLTLNQNGTFTYTPSPGFYGTDQFTYQADDGRGGTALATVTLQVNGALAAPAESYTLDTTSQLTVLAPGVLAADSLPADQAATVTATQPQHGTLTMNADGSFVYAPTSGYTGTDSFTYTVTLPDNETASNTVSLTVQSAAPGHVSGGQYGDQFRVWQSADGSGTLNAMSDSQGVELRYALAPADFTQWNIAGGAGNDRLQVDYANGDPLPSGGLYFDGGGHVAASASSAVSGNELNVIDLGTTNVTAGLLQIMVDGSEPITYANVQAVNLIQKNRLNFPPEVEQTLLNAPDTLTYAGNAGYIGDPESALGTIAITGTATVGNLWILVASQLSGGGTINFTSSGTDLEGYPNGLYYGGGTSIFSGSINGPGILDVFGGKLTLSGKNTFTGGTVVNAGTLVIAAPSALPDGANLTVGSTSHFSSIIAASAPTTASTASVVSGASDAFVALPTPVLAETSNPVSESGIATSSVGSPAATATPTASSAESVATLATTAGATRADHAAAWAIDRVMAAGTWRKQVATMLSWTDRRDHFVPTVANSVMFDAEGRPVL